MTATLAVSPDQDWLAAHCSASVHRALLDRLLEVIGHPADGDERTLAQLARSAFARARMHGDTHAAATVEELFYLLEYETFSRGYHRAAADDPVRLRQATGTCPDAAITPISTRTDPGMPNPDPLDVRDQLEDTGQLPAVMSVFHLVPFTSACRDLARFEPLPVRRPA